MKKKVKPLGSVKFMNGHHKTVFVFIYDFHAPEAGL